MASLIAPAIGGPIIAAAPLNKISNPKALVSLSNPKRSTRIIDVREIYPAVGIRESCVNY